MGSCCCCFGRSSAEDEPKVQAVAATSGLVQGQSQGFSPEELSPPEQSNDCQLPNDFNLLMAKVDFVLWTNYNADPSCKTTASDECEIHLYPDLNVHFYTLTKILSPTLESKSLSNPESREVIAFKQSDLEQDQGPQLVFKNVPVIQEITNCLLTESVLRYFRANPDAELFDGQVKASIYPPYTTLTMIVPGVYMTGFFGLVDSRLSQEDIKLIVNVSSEIPMYKGKEITAIRVPVVDSDKDDHFEHYFDDVAEVIECARRAGVNTVVHSMAGVSRSATIVMAYLMKNTGMSLYDAFVHTKMCRPCIRPSMAFMNQLILYEFALTDSVSTGVSMVKFTDESSKRQATVPDFYQSLFPGLIQIELERQN